MIVFRPLTTHLNVLKVFVRCVSVRKMSNTQVNVKFQSCLLPSNPEYHPVLFVGQASHLECLTWEDAQCKLRPNVTEEAWTRGMSSVLDSPGECCEIWPKAASVATLPARRSRHAAPSRCHALANLAKAAHRKGVENIVVVCEKRDVFASALAIARCVPLFNMRSAVSLLDNDAAPPPPRQLAVQFKLVPPVKDGPSDEDSLGPLDPYLEDVVLSDEDIVHIQAAADSVRLAARITDTPTNFMDVDQFIQEAIKVAKDLKIAEPTIIRGEELKEKGLGGIYGVGKAAECPPALVVLSYKTASPRTVAWVGKGIVYDTGGLSIKARTSMVGMKGDCGGAAAVLGAFFTAVRAGPSVNLHAVLCLAENAVGPKATRPDDIHQLYSGRTVEINNTDAEGRLVLSDGVVYAQRDLKADTIVDIATLTGAQGTATGKYHAAILSNSGVVERQCVRAGLSCGDLAHPLPFAPELHFPEFTSVVADMKNSVADRGNAQASCAGLFILAHLGFDFPGKWLHIDMAAPAHSGERATGYGVGLLSVLFGAHTKSRLLNALSPGPIA